MDGLNCKDVLIDVIELSKRLCVRSIEGSLAYGTKENFLGRIVDGYRPDALKVCLLTGKAAVGLCHAQKEFLRQGFTLFIFDAFRPLRAVRDFSSWYHEPVIDEYEKERKKIHYPHLEKEDLVRLGYAPDGVSRHCFGNAVDVSLIRIENGQFLNMGTEFDYFDESSHPDVPAEVIGEDAVRNRQLLIQTMQQFGFISYPYEWWHFDYLEREVDQPMDMEIVPELKGLGVEY
jgi:D-alanyl-D-alanine dipeptidase